MIHHVYKEEASQAAVEYVQKESHGPFFLAFDNKEDLDFLIGELSSCKKLRMSQYCPRADSTIDKDRLRHDLDQSAAHKEHLLLLGVGEYATLLKDQNILNMFRNYLNSNRKVILPIWQGYDFLKKLVDDDYRVENAYVLPKTGAWWSYRRITFDLPAFLEKQLFDEDICQGFRPLLEKVEKGCEDTLFVKTDIKLNEDYGRTLASAYDVYCENHPDTKIPQKFFSEEWWIQFLDEDRERDAWLLSEDSLLDVLEHGHPNKYIQSVVAHLSTYDDFERTFAQHIFEIPESLHEKDTDFTLLNNAMKELLQSNSNLQERFLDELRDRFDPQDRLPYLDGGTLLEQEEILSIVASMKKLPAELEKIYPQLFSYVQKFSFTSEQVGLENQKMLNTLSDYFHDYKKQKVLNEIFPAFLNTVENIGETRLLYKIPHRGGILDKLKEEGAKLIWVDALGCEYLAFLQAQSKKLGLCLQIHIAQGVLPSITATNRDFFDLWDETLKKKIDNLDRIKHGEDDESSSCKDASIHLAKELLVLDSLLQEIEHDLKHKHQKKIIVASDHGASRLAVIVDPKLTTLWSMTESGEHCGRCCKIHANDSETCVIPPQRICMKSNDGMWYALANYDRFKGSRQGLVEVHGGATLEEVLVPILEFTLLHSSDNAFHSSGKAKKLFASLKLKKESFKFMPNDPHITLTLFCEDSLQNVHVFFQGKEYPLQKIERQYIVQLFVPKPGQYVLELYKDQEKIKELPFTLEGPVKQNPAFDF